MTSTEGDKSLVERLLRTKIRRSWIIRFPGSDVWLVNPDGRDAAARITSYAAERAVLAAEVAMLKEALGKVRDAVADEYAYAEKREKEDTACRYREGIAEGTCDTMNRVNEIIGAALQQPALTEGTEGKDDVQEQP